MPDQSLTLGQKQELFVLLQAEFVTWVYAQGWRLRPGEGFVYFRRKVATPGGTEFRDDRVHRLGSVHYEGLAQDWNLFVGGKWITTNSPEWQKLGAKWKTLNPLCRWGGDFQSVDLNHFSLEHAGVM